MSLDDMVVEFLGGDRMKSFTKGLDDYALIVVELLMGLLFVLIFGPFNVVVVIGFIRYLHPAAERQGMEGIVILYFAALCLFILGMFGWWYLVLDGFLGIPWSNREC
jgi:hypothetical protein